MRWPLLVLAHLFLRVVGLFLLAGVLARLPDTARRLPMWAVWWDNYTDGIDGDPDHRDRRAKGWSVFRRRWVWLAWRNPVHNWSRYVGCVQSQCEVVHFGAEPSDYHGRAGRLVSFAFSPDGRWYWQEYGIKQWPGLQRCVRWRVGWKLKPTADATYIAALVYYVHPFKRFGPRE
jgi:hypothetical protein